MLRVFENRGMRIFGPKRGKVIGVSKRLCYGKLSDLYYSPNIIRVIKSRRMKWAGHVARMGERRDAYKFFSGETSGKEPIWKTET